MTLVGILILATLAESLVEYLVAPLLSPLKNDGDPGDNDEKAELGVVLLRYTAAAVGIALCIVYKADLFALLGISAIHPVVGYVVTGFLVGRGATFVHDFASRWLKPPS